MARRTVAVASLLLLATAFCLGCAESQGRRLQQNGIRVTGPKQSTLPSLEGPEGSYQQNDGRVNLKFRTGGIQYGKEIDLGGVELTGQRPAFVSTIPFTFGLLTGRKMK